MATAIDARCRHKYTRDTPLAYSICYDDAESLQTRRIYARSPIAEDLFNIILRDLSLL